MKHRIRAIIGVVVLASTFFSSARVSASFSDIQENPHRRAILYLQAKGILGGYDDGTYRPENAVNRAELLKILIGSLNLSPDSSKYKNCFPDVQDQWFAPFVCFAKESKWVSGYPDGTFHPEKTVNAAEAIKMIVVASGYPLLLEGTLPYTDVPEDSWFRQYVLAAYNAGIVPKDAEELGVGIDMNRGDVAAILYLSVLGGDQGLSSNSSSLSSSSSSVVSRRRNGAELSSSSVASSVSSSKSTTSITFASVTKNFGDQPFSLTPYSNSYGLFTFTSGNTAVATIVGDIVTIVSAGASTITASQAAMGTYTAGTATMTLTVNPVKPAIGVFSNVTRSTSDSLTFTIDPPLSNSPGAFTYTSNNLDAITISGNTATVVNPGTATITAKQAATTNYKEDSVTAIFTVLGYCATHANPCANGGSCVDSAPSGGNVKTTFTCSCTSGYTGTTCTEPN